MDVVHSVARTFHCTADHKQSKEIYKPVVVPSVVVERTYVKQTSEEAFGGFDCDLCKS